MGTRTEGQRSATSANLSGNNFVETALHGMGGGPAAKPSAVTPMPDILGDKSSNSEGEGIGSDDASPPKDAEAGSADHHRPTVAPTVEVSEDEVEARSLVAPSWGIEF